MRVPLLPLTLALLLAGCTANPAAQPAGTEGPRSVSLGKQAGAATGVAPKAPKVPESVLKPAASLIGLDGSTLVGQDGGSFISGNGGGIIANKDEGGEGPSVTARPSMPDEPGPLPGPSAAPSSNPALAAPITGTVRLPAAIADPTRTDQLPVANATVALFKPSGAGAALAEVKADAKGAYAFPRGEAPGLYLLRARVLIAGVTYYTAALIHTGKPDPSGDQDAGSTLIAARFLAATKDHAAAPTAAGLDPAAWNADARTYGGRVPPKAIDANALPADQLTAWEALAKANPAMTADEALETFLKAETGHSH